MNLYPNFPIGKRCEFRSSSQNYSFTNEIDTFPPPDATEKIPSNSESHGIFAIRPVSFEKST